MEDYVMYSIVGVGFQAKLGHSLQPARFNTRK